MYKIYQARHVPTGKSYIGITKVPLLKRIGQHLGLTEYKQEKFQRFLHTTQYSEWSWDILFEVENRQEAYALEADMIKDFKAAGIELLNGTGIGGRVYDDPSTWLKEHQFKPGEASWNKGRQGVSDDTREKMRIARLRKPVRYIPTAADAQRTRSLLGKKIVCVETGQEFDSISQAAVALGLHRGNIRKVLQGKQTYAKGFSFRYKEETAG